MKPCVLLFIHTCNCLSVRNQCAFSFLLQSSSFTSAHVFGGGSACFRQQASVLEATPAVGALPAGAYVCHRAYDHAAKKIVSFEELKRAGWIEVPAWHAGSEKRVAPPPAESVVSWATAVVLVLFLCIHTAVQQ